MPIGIVVLLVGIVIGAVVGLLMGNIVLGGSTGFVLAFAYLLIASWMDRRQDKEG
jgi:hypothetical protein